MVGSSSATAALLQAAIYTTYVTLFQCGWGVIEPPRGAAVFILSIGLLCLLTEGALFVVGGCLVALGVMMWLFIRTAYAVVIETATGEHKVLKEKNRRYVEQVIHALDAALVNRGVVPVTTRESAKATGVDFAQMSQPLIE
jgi:hypothetical protein